MQKNAPTHALVQTVADRLLFVARLYAEVEGSAVDLDEFGGHVDAHADRRRRVVPHIKVDAEALMALRQQLFDRIERGESEADRWQIEQRIRHAENQLTTAG